jgi:hypothetical protein
MRGDLLFYTPKDWIGSVIAWSTNGPFSHVAIDMGDGTKIEADWNGVVRVAESKGEVAAVFNTAKDVPDFEQGLTWLQQQLGNPYGKEDIFNQVLRLMGFKFYIGEPKRYDCSDLAADYLVHAHAAWILGPYRDSLHMVTPNDLASILSVKLPKHS